MPARRLSARRRLQRPIEAEIRLCEDASVSGWIVDEQDDGLGMMFGGGDVAQLTAHATCCMGEGVTVCVSEPGGQPHRIPMRLAHLTDDVGRAACRAGLAFDLRRMQAEDVVQLIDMWRRFHRRAQPA